MRNVFPSSFFVLMSFLHHFNALLRSLLRLTFLHSLLIFSLRKLSLLLCHSLRHPYFVICYSSLRLRTSSYFVPLSFLVLTSVVLTFFPSSFPISHYFVIRYHYVVFGSLLRRLRFFLHSCTSSLLRIPVFFPSVTLSSSISSLRHSPLSLPSFPYSFTVTLGSSLRHSRVPLPSFPSFFIVIPEFLYRHSRVSLSSFPRRRESSR